MIEDSNAEGKVHGVAKLRWEDYKMRQAHYWSSLNRFTIAIITLWVIPFVKPELVKVLGNYVLIFPAIAFLLSLTSTWLLGAEYQRLRTAKGEFERLIGAEYTLPRPKGTWWERRCGASIGYVTTRLFGFGFSTLSLFDVYLLLRVARGK